MPPLFLRTKFVCMGTLRWRQELAQSNNTSKMLKWQNLFGLRNFFLESKLTPPHITWCLATNAMTRKIKRDSKTWVFWVHFCVHFCCLPINRRDKMGCKKICAILSALNQCISRLISISERKLHFWLWFTLGSVFFIKKTLQTYKLMYFYIKRKLKKICMQKCNNFSVKNKLQLHLHFSNIFQTYFFMGRLFFFLLIRARMLSHFEGMWENAVGGAGIPLLKRGRESFSFLLFLLGSLHFENPQARQIFLNFFLFGLQKCGKSRGGKKTNFGGMRHPFRYY